MVCEEILSAKLVRHYSDDPTKALLQVETGIIYDEAIDKRPCRYTYVEVDKPEEMLEEGAEQI